MRTWLVLLVLLTACQKSVTRPKIPCTSIADCQDGQQCLFNSCVGASCESELQCPYTQTCTNTYCTDLPANAPRPNITAVLGNNTGGACSQTPGIPCVNDGIILIGTGLSGVTTGVLSGNDTEFPLNKTGEQNGGVVFSLPAGILPGVLYTLIIGNTSGRQAITMQFIQGDTGARGAACAENADDLVTLLNSASTQLTVGALPTGTGANTVALGNHTHDDRYININDGSATVAALTATHVNVDSVTFAAASLGTCSAAQAGRIARDNVDDRLWLCNASTWVPISDAVKAPDGSYARPARSCWEIHKAYNLKGATLSNETFNPGSVTGRIASGRRFLRTTAGEVYEAYCDMTTAGGGWTLVVKLSGQSAELNVADNRWWESPYNPSSYSAGNGEINTKPAAWAPGLVYSTGNSAHVAPNGPLLADGFSVATSGKNVIGPGFAHVPFGDVMIQSLGDASKHLAWSHFAKQTNTDTYLPDPSLGKFPNALAIVRAANRVGTPARISGNLNLLQQTAPNTNTNQNECLAKDNRQITQYGFFLFDDIGNLSGITITVNGQTLPAAHGMGIIGAAVLNRISDGTVLLTSGCQTNFGFGGHYLKGETACTNNSDKDDCYNINGHHWNNGNDNLNKYTAHGMFVR